MIYLMSADYRDMSVWDSTAGTVSLSDDTARTGTYSFKTIANTGRLRKIIAPSVDVYVRAAISLSGSSASWRIFFMDPDLSTTHAYVAFALDDLLLSVNAGPASPSVGVPTFVSFTGWMVVEVCCVLHATTGSIQVKVSGNTIFHEQNINTINGASGTVGQISFGNTSGVTRNVYFDDIVIRDDRWPGRGGIHVLDPVADGTDDAWTPSAGTDKYATVDDNPPDDFVDYIETDAAVAGTKQLFDPDALSGVWFPVGSCVQVNNKAKLTSGHANLSGLLFDGVDRFSGALGVVGPTDKHVTHAKDVTTLTGLEFGVETVAWS